MVYIKDVSADHFEYTDHADVRVPAVGEVYTVTLAVNLEVGGLTGRDTAEVCDKMMSTIVDEARKLGLDCEVFTQTVCYESGIGLVCSDLDESDLERMKEVE